MTPYQAMSIVPARKPPTFGTPIFSMRLSNDQFYQIGKNNRIIRFREFYDHVEKIELPKECRINRQLGDLEIFAFVSQEGHFIVGEKQEIEEELVKQFEVIEGRPFLKRAIARFLEREELFEQAERLIGTDARFANHTHIDIPAGKPVKLSARNVGPYHFIGIGGVGVSGVAELLVQLGYDVQGSDVVENANIRRLRGLGVDVEIGHKTENLKGAQVAVVSAAIQHDNPELVAARDWKIPVLRRNDVVAEMARLKSTIAVGGTHGKSTTTAIIGELLYRTGLDPTVIRAGIVNTLGSNARLGESDWLVVEADEADTTFVRLASDIAVVTNIDPEHVDHYGSFDRLREAFLAFVENVPFYGFAVMCIDHPEVQTLVERIHDRRVITYGTSSQAEVQLLNTRYGEGFSSFDVRIRNPIDATDRVIDGLRLPMLGLHNALNAAAAIAVAAQLGIGDDVIRGGIDEFQGVRRRFTLAGEWNGVSIYDDYGHHPVEIAAVLRAARDVTSGRVLAVVQPHRYTRLQDLFEEFCRCFNEADGVLVAPVYEAGEAPITGIDRDALVEGLRNLGHRFALAINGPDDLPKAVADFVRPGDTVVCLGAGTISQWAKALPNQLEVYGPVDLQGPSITEPK